MPPITFERVAKSFGDVAVVHEFDLEIHDRELLVLVGGSGSGKSTILRMLAGLETVSAGRIRIGERDVTNLPPRERDVAMVFQDYALYPHLSVRDNLSLGLRLRRVRPAEIERRVRWAAGVLGIEPLLDRRPRQLSGGQRQRVAMGRAMVREPLAFLFDEPLSNLDAALRGQMRVEIGLLQRRLGTTTIYVTHDQVEAMTLADRIVVLAQGRIQQVGRPEELYRSPANRLVAGFLGSPPMNFIEGRVELEAGRALFVAEGLRIPLDAGRSGPLPEPVSLGIRPEHLHIGDAELPGSSSGRVVLVERLGGTSHVHVDVGPHRLVATLAADAAPAVGAMVGVRLPAAQAHLFDAGGRAIRQP